MVLFVLCILLAAGVATAAKDVKVIALDDDAVNQVVAGDAKGDCIYGNAAGPAYAIGDWIWGAESYSYFVFPPEVTCGCASGFRVESLSLMAQFGPEDVPVTFDAYVTLDEGVTDIMPPPCWRPGVQECVSTVLTFTITEAGLYNLTVPIYEDCDCAYLDYGYFLSFHFADPFDESMRPDMITDDAPVGCMSYNDYGSGWSDLFVDFGFPGEIMLTADIVCCENPVATEEATWGTIRALYR